MTTDNDGLPLMLSVKQVAQLVGMTPASVRRNIKTGRIPADRIGGTWRICRDVLFPDGLDGKPVFAQPREPLHGELPDEDALPDEAEFAPSGASEQNVAVQAPMRELRVKAGYKSASELAAAAGVSNAIVTKLERGTGANMTLKSAQKIADALECPIDLVAGRTFDAYFSPAYAVQRFYDNLSPARKGEMDAFMSYLEFMERYNPAPAPTFDHANHVDLIE